MIAICYQALEAEFADRFCNDFNGVTVSIDEDPQPVVVRAVRSVVSAMSAEGYPAEKLYPIKVYVEDGKTYTVEAPS